MIAKKHGSASDMSSQSIFLSELVISNPTMTKTGAVARAGIIEIRGDKKSRGKNMKAAKIAVSPVRPPCFTPTADSI